MTTVDYPATERQAEVGNGSVTRQRPFSDDQCAMLHAEDRKAAAAVIGVMTTIFLIAVSLYTGIAIWVYRGW